MWPSGRSGASRTSAWMSTGFRLSCVTLEDPGSSHLLKAMSVKNATDIKQHLALLEHERVLALDTALRDDPRYMADLEEEILATRHAYVGSAVIEIAHLRATLGGANWG